MIESLQSGRPKATGIHGGDFPAVDRRLLSGHSGLECRRIGRDVVESLNQRT